MRYKMKNNSTIEWEGPGTYVAMRMRGPTHYQKLPQGKTPRPEVIVTEFATKPEEYETPEPQHHLWQ